MVRYFSIRANGETAHNNPETPWYYPADLPVLPRRDFDYTSLCLRDGFARIGWPDTGDLSKLPIIPARTKAYKTINELNRKQLEMLRDVEVGDVIVLPRKGHDAYHIGTVTAGYRWHLSSPVDPYECAHRVLVLWDVRPDNLIVTYTSAELRLGRTGNPFEKALCEILKREAVSAIEGRPRSRLTRS